MRNICYCVVSTLIIFGLTFQSIYASTEVEKKVIEKTDEIELAAKWLFHQKNDGDYQKTQIELLSKHPYSIIPVRKTDISAGLPKHELIDVYALVLSLNRLVLFSTEKGKINMYFGASVSPNLFEETIGYNAYKFLELSENEVNFNDLLITILQASVITEAFYNAEIIVKNQNFSDRIIIGLENHIVLTTLDLHPHITESNLVDFMFTLWSGLEMGINLGSSKSVQLFNSKSSISVEKSCVEYLNSTL